MKKPLIIFLILITPIVSFSQGKEYKKITSKENPKYIEEYHVLKSNPEVKNGRYKKLSYRKKVLEIGYYKNGIKDSIWTIYPKFLDSSSRGAGKYKDEKKVGVWSYYFNGKLDQKYDHSLNKIIYSANYSASDSVYAGDRYIGGVMFITNHIIGNIRYPREAVEKGIQGSVYVLIYITENGDVEKVEVLKSVHSLLDEEAVKLAKTIPPNWIPEEKEGGKVPSKYLFPVRFSLGW